MNDEIREQLSALLDEELDTTQRPLLVGRLQRDLDLRKCLGRYELIGEVMRGAGLGAGLGIAERVAAAMNDERELASSPAGTSVSRWWKPVAGLAVAASVALVAVVSVNVLRPPAAEVTPLALEDTTSVTQVAESTPVPASQWDRIEPRVDERLNGYLVNHNEFAASRGVQGVMPYVRIVGFETAAQ